MKIVFTLFFVHIVSYWTTVFLYTLIYNQWNKESKKVIYNVLINQFYYTSIYYLPFIYYPQPFESNLHGIWQIPVIILLTDVIFYFSHRYFHYNKTLYNFIHKRHHEYDPPIASAALYSHPIEHLCVNLFSTVVPLFIVKANLTISILWTFIASVNVVIAHSGTWKNDPHTAHHKYLNCNYGVGPLFMDRIMKTFRK